MSELHVRQISAAIEQAYESLIDMSDYASKSESARQSAFLSRAQGAYVLAYITGEPAADVAAGVTDGGKDNGIDAIVYHAAERRLYLLQSKWKKNGTGSVSRGDIGKFIKGFNDLINARWSRFNEKVRAMSSLLESALNDSSTRLS